MANAAQAPSHPLELEKFLPYRLSVLAQRVSESLHDLYAQPYGLTVTQWRVMAALGRFAPLTASEVGLRIVMDKVAVSRAVAGLMQRGLIERNIDDALYDKATFGDFVTVQVATRMPNIFRALYKDQVGTDPLLGTVYLRLLEFDDLRPQKAIVRFILDIQIGRAHV